MVISVQSDNLLHSLKASGIHGVTAWTQKNASKAGQDEIKIPEMYIRMNQDERANLEFVQSVELPIVDFTGLDDVNRRQVIVQQLDQAFKDWGFVQIINHGIPEKLMDRIVEMEKQIFEKSEEEMSSMYDAGSNASTHPTSGQFGTSFAPLVETVRDWRDVLKHHFFPGWESDSRPWPSDPYDYREVIVSYQRNCSVIGQKIFKLLAEALGIEEEFLLEYHEWNRSPSNVNLINYPPCPQPDLSMGFTTHCDPGSMNLLLTDYDVPGLNILKNGKYYAVMPQQYAVIVNVGDALQILTNDIYKSTPHRVAVNTERARISIVAFYGCAHEVRTAQHAEPPSEIHNGRKTEAVQGRGLGPALENVCQHPTRRKLPSSGHVPIEAPY
ncbi:hypothetical protein Mapa_003425 [Marchantia paleacea]|nr:hypothetical protein Mapa_003425 [Marchantia paleacea]